MLNNKNDYNIAWQTKNDSKSIIAYYKRLRKPIQ